MNAKQGFNWKTIENKPEDWEKLHRLIQDSYIKEEEQLDRYWLKGELFIEVMVNQYPDMKNMYEKKTEKKKTKNVNKKQEIKDKVEKEIIKKDIQNIRFDQKMRPMNIHFSMEITFVIMIYIWNINILNKIKIEPQTVLDAVISLNRILDKESNNLEKYVPTLWENMNKLREEINKIKINELMYNLLFENPVYLVESTADKRKKGIKLYEEQKIILDKITDAIIMDTPILMGNQMPTGTGKSFLAVPLAQKINNMKRNKTVLFACSNDLVNQDIASTALLGDDIHLWMSALIRDKTGNTQVLLRPYKRCFPAKWKSVYKTEDRDKMGSIEEQWNYYTDKTGKYPDIIVADLEACYELLLNAESIENPFIAYIDEFISDEISNKMMAKICKVLPKQTVLLSAILPRFNNMRPIIDHFQKRYETNDFSLYRVETNNVPITCAIIDQNGYIRMPHHNIKTVEELELLLIEMENNPRIRRCYTARHVYYWAKSIDDILKEHQLDFMCHFPDIGKIQNNRIILYAIKLLEFLKIKFEYIERFKDYRPKIMNPPNKLEIFKEQCHEYEGKTLFISNDVFQHLYEATETLYDKEIKWSNIVNQTKKNEMMKERQLEKVKNIKVTRDSNFNKLEKDRDMYEILQMQTVATLGLKYVLNSKEHFMRYNQDKTIPKNLQIRVANVLPEYYNESFNDEELLMLASGIGFYDKKRMTNYQRNLIMNIYNQLCFICSCKDIVFGTNLPKLVNIFITKEFAEMESVGILYQLMGRVGRMGKSYHANIILDDEISVQKILSLDSNIDDKHVASLLSLFLNNC